MAWSVKRSTNRYVDAFGFTNEPAPSSLSNLSRGGIHPAQGFDKTTGFGDMEGIFSALRRTAGRMPGLVANVVTAPLGFRNHPTTRRKVSGFRDDTFRQQHAPNRRIRPTPWATPFHLGPQPTSMLARARLPTGMGDLYNAQLGALLQGIDDDRNGPGWPGHSQGMSGNVLDTIVGGVTGAVDSATARADKLQNALYIILGLSGIAAATGLLSAFRRR